MSQLSADLSREIKFKKLARWSGAGLLLMLAAQGAFADPSAKCDHFLTSYLNSQSNSRLKVLVTLDQTPNASVSRSLKSLGFDVTRHLSLVHAVAGEIPQKNLKRLSRLESVKSLALDSNVRKNDSFTVDSSLANAAWSKYSVAGNGVGVAVIDSGIYDADPDFNCLQSILGIVPIGHRVSAMVDFTGLGVEDQCGHGTHVGGIIAGDGSQSQGLLDTQTFYGVAPGASLISVRVLDSQGEGSVSNVISAIQWCVTNKAKYNLRVINLSMGHPVGQSYTQDPLCQAVEAAWKSGIVVVCAAGNNGRLNANTSFGAPNSGYGTNYWSVESPGNDPYVITVGATKSIDGMRKDDQIASYSGRGPSVADFILKPDIIAPGNAVVSCEDPNHSYLTTTYGSQVMIKNSSYQTLGSGWSKSYFCISGTSMATPVVSGVAALMLQQNPNLSPDTIKARLMISADKWTDPFGLGDPCTYGAGYVDAPAAIASTVVATTYALSPTLQEDAFGDVYAALNANIYGQRAMWGTGTTMEGVYGSRAMWGTGGNNLTDSRAMWGTGGNWTEGASNTTYSSSSLDLSSTSILANGD